MFFPPFLIFFAFIFVFLLLLVFGLIQFGLFAWAFTRLGISPEYLFSLLFLCIVGSMINLPLRRIKLHEDVQDLNVVRFFGMRYRPPKNARQDEMVLAVNVGGAVIPAVLSCFLLVNSPSPLRMLAALVAVTFVVHKIARPIQGVGIAVPMFLPPVVAALSAMVFNYDWAAPTAYFAGTIGTLIGADILHLDKLRRIRAPVASIGGAGTFDSIFLTGILAVLLAPVGS